MARPVTLQQLRADIADQCDVVSGSTGRYSASLLNRFLNKSIQRFRERLSTEGITHYLVSKSGNLSSGPTSPFPFQVLDMSSFDPGVVRTFGVDITYNGRVTSLEHRPFQERATFGSTTDTGCPIAWAHYQTDKIAIFPAPDAGYAYTVWYLPVYDDLADADTFDGVAGWEDYLVQDVVCRVLNRDQYLAAVQSAERQRDGIFADLLRAATKVSAAGGAVRGRDTFGAYAVGYGRRGPIAAGGVGVSDGTITNAKLAEMAAQTIKANIQSVPAQPTDATPAQIASILPHFSGTSGGLVPTGSGNPALFLTNAGTWVAPSIGGSVSGLTLDQIQNIPGPRVLGNVGPTGAVTPLLGQQVASMLAVFTGSAHGLVPHPTGGALGRVLDDSGQWVAQSGGVSSGIANNQLLAMPPLAFKGNFGSTSGVPADLDKRQAASLMPNFFQASGAGRGFVVAPTGGAAGNVLQDDGTWVPQTGGGGGPTMLAEGPAGAVQFNGGSGFAGASGFRYHQGTGLTISDPVHLPTGYIAIGSGAAQGHIRGPRDFAIYAKHVATGTEDYPVVRLIPNLYGTNRPGVVLGGGAEMLEGAQLETATGPVDLKVGTVSRLRVDGGGALMSVPITAPHLNVQAGGRIGLAQLAVADPVGDKLAAWTASGFANHATGIRVVGSGQALAFGASPATEGDLRASHGSTVLAGMNQAGGAALPILRFGIALNDSLILGGGSEGITRIQYETTTGDHLFRIANDNKARVTADQFRLETGKRLAVAQFAVADSVGDKLAGWTASGFANHATGIHINASGTRLSVGSGGPMLHASGIDMRNGDIRNVRRLNGMDGIRLYGDLPDSNADVAEPSGTAFIIPLSTTQGRIFTIVPSGTEHGKVVLIENRSAYSHSIYNSGTGMGAASGWIATLAPSGGMSARFASGAWEFGVKYQLGGF